MYPELCAGVEFGAGELEAGGLAGVVFPPEEMPPAFKVAVSFRDLTAAVALHLLLKYARIASVFAFPDWSMIYSRILRPIVVSAVSPAVRLSTGSNG